ncbi:MAG TPA: cobamide remodeling phosphodiesterase CbiR [Syntrophobacteria bacterium]|nr:cobamide remodeling phosphodiesterase CbiR [Syntrophobacteria bacterium]
MRPEATVSPASRRKPPFRLGTTSYIYAAEILPNVRSLKGKVEDIEIVLFESDEVSNYPSRQEREELAAIGQQNRLSYTVHLPLDVLLGDPRPRVRQRSVDTCLRAIEATAGLRPHGYIVHFQGLPTDDHGRWLNEAWLTRLDQSVGQLLGHLDYPQLLCAETLSYPFHLVEELIERRDLSICLDVGHIILYDQPLELYLRRYLSRTRVIHLHGNSGGRDHLDLGHVPAATLELVFTSLATLPKVDDLVVTLEIFSEKDLEISRLAVEKYLS